MTGAVAVLCTRSDSPYLSMEGVDCYDIERDCRSFAGGMPVIAHPPCRAWSRLRSFAKPRPDELEVALFCLDAVRRFGGVLEHPSGTLLLRYLVGCWHGRRDAWGGTVIAAGWWGHRALKRTWLYVVRRPVPAFPFVYTGSGTVERMGRAERERTPPAFARWLVELARGAA